MIELFRKYHETTETIFFKEYPEEYRVTVVKIEITTKINAIHNFTFKVVLYPSGDPKPIELFTETIKAKAFGTEEEWNRLKEEKIDEILGNIKQLNF